MRVLLVSDEESGYIWEHFDPVRFGGVELILSCGDLKRAYLEFLVTMIPAPLFYVPGNHDKDFVRLPPEGCLSVDGRVEVFRGLRVLGLGGCRSPRLAAYEYTEDSMARRVRAALRQVRKAGGIDVLLTHAPVFGLGDGDDTFHRGFESFRLLLSEAAPRHHFFGHQHDRYGRAADRFQFGGTTLIRAGGYKLLDL